MILAQRHIVFFLGVLLFPVLLHGQNFTQKLAGRVQNPDRQVSDVYVVNINNKKSTITDTNGYFTIPVRFQDTLIFSAVQFKRMEIVVSYDILTSKFLLVPLEETITQLDEVVLMPYGLVGDLKRDVKPESVVTASTLGLPNAYVIPRTQSERLLYTAKTWDFKGTSICMDPAINWLSGRTLMLRKRVARDYQQKEMEQLERFYTDSLLISTLKIPNTKINDFLYFCEVDPEFKDLMDRDDKLQLLEFFKVKEGEYLTLTKSP
ncbi:carboxypeptidase-like regulatory domain-containing protein [Flavobacteriaceae bacterium F89]|uniref:Carboxypeptidase-like regulatory domain-containing protein n=1 Tax=Cerina litoralis TaxID=2874477 RepID=A0AAE3EU84_9FLAO|nr:carboxypeptidase-like regulatory domain-containing protein [Cerina litoralis]MCG2461210.1 carboxypeptidase-like regulatory domain-containing protein [Cerina litoralis]